MEALANERWPTLIWVRSGAARLATSDETHELDTGEALWVPAGVSLDVRTAPESVVLPILLPLDTSPAPLDHVLRLVVPPGWEDWLVHRYACMLGYGYGGPSTHWSVLDWVAASPVGTTADTRAKRIPPPYSPSARAVAERLLKGELSRPLSEFARAAGISERTLQRQFATETGVSFARWRRMARVQAAARHLAAGRPVTWVADQVGYRSPGVLAHAFRAETGRAPSRHAGARATLVESPDLL